MRWRRLFVSRRSPSSRQRVFPYVERSERLHRWFKRAIATLTVLGAVGLLAGTGVGRYACRRVALAAKAKATRLIGLPVDRTLVDEQWRIERGQNVARVKSAYHEIYGRIKPQMRRVVEFAGLGPDEAVIRWGGYNQTMVLPSKAFETDDSGRSYRMRPCTRSVWLKAIDLPDSRVRGFFLMPDSPELPGLIQGTGAYIVPGSSQTTNTWGCRGPEPDVSAPLRGLILGDSNMQGLLVGDDDTPPECLRRELESRVKARVSLLNTGHLGYAPEQIYYTLLEYGPRFRPNFVVFSFCSNDYGNAFDRVPNGADIEEGGYWTTQILDYCVRSNLLCVVTPIPNEGQMVSLRFEGRYPGRICDILGVNSLRYCNPIEDFADEHLRILLERQRQGTRPSESPLFNGRHRDGHMSAIGAAVWGKALGRRLGTLLEDARASGRLKF